MFNIVDKYGELKYSEPQEMCPELEYGSFGGGGLQTISDGQGGAIMATSTCPYIENPGIYSQRLDSLGNRMWGDSGVQVFPFAESPFSICSDCNGGVFVVIHLDEGTLDYSDLYIQHLDGDGSQLFGPTGMIMSSLPNHSERYPEIASDGNGGAFVIWEDHRPPYSTYGAVFAQRIDYNGNLLWSSDLFICEDDWDHDMISDGEGGVIIQANPGGNDPFTHWRVDAEGNILWERDHLSWYNMDVNSIQMVSGEPGYFYLCFAYYFSTPYERGFYCQRVDLDGNPCWPSWPEALGLQLFADPEGRTSYFTINCNFNDNYLHVVYQFKHLTTNDYYVYTNRINFSGNLIWGEDGVLFQQEWASPHNMNICTASDTGIVFTYYQMNDAVTGFDILAKRVNADGALGGPNAALTGVTLAASGNDLILSWPVKARSASYYVYKSFQPYAFPSEPFATVSDTVFTDVNALFEGAGYYNVRWEPR